MAPQLKYDGIQTFMEQSLRNRATNKRKRRFGEILVGFFG
jgi:hypothetical protein